MNTQRLFGAKSQGELTFYKEIVDRMGITVKHSTKKRNKKYTRKVKKGGGILNMLASFLQYTENYSYIFDYFNTTNLLIYFPTQFDHKVRRAQKLIIKNIKKANKIPLIDQYKGDSIKETLTRKLELYESYYHHTILLEECELELVDRGEKISGSQFTDPKFLRTFVNLNNGLRAIIRCYCGIIYRKNPSEPPIINIFEGELRCTIVSPTSEDEEKYGWDAILIPNGYDKSLLHLKDESYKVDVRNLPYSQIQALLAPSFEGLFETHITLSLEDIDMSSSKETILSELHNKWELFIKLCQQYENQLRPLCIFEQGNGEKLDFPQIQFQTARYNVFKNPDLAIQNAINTKNFFIENGLKVARTRVEAMAGNKLVPQHNSNINTVKSIGSSLENKYFETHLRINIMHPITIKRNSDMEKVNKIKDLIATHTIDGIFEPHISFNGTKGFLNARGFNIGNDRYTNYWNALRDDIFSIPDVEIPDKHEHREYAIYDDDIFLDDSTEAQCIVPQIVWITAAIKGGV